MKTSTSSLPAVFLLTNLTSLRLDLTAGDCLCHLPWEDLPGLRKLHTCFVERVAQGTFGFLPRVCTLEVLQADIDFFSVSCLPFLSNQTSLDLCLAPPEHGHLSIRQSRERYEEALLQVAKLSKLQKPTFCQEAYPKAIERLAVLSSLTSLDLLLPKQSAGGLSIWDVKALFVSNWLRLQHLHFEFKLDHEFVVASMEDAEEVRSVDSTISMSDISHNGDCELLFPVPWSTRRVVVKPFA